jgi:hypothetical protein
MHNSAVYKQADGFTTEFEDMRQVQGYCPAAEVSDLTSSNLAPSRDLKMGAGYQPAGRGKKCGRLVGLASRPLRVRVELGMAESYSVAFDMCTAITCQPSPCF